MYMEVNKLEEFRKVINQNKVVVAFFWATWCGPCRMMSPTFDKLSSEHSGAVFIKVNADDAAETAEEVGIRAMPTFMVFKNGQKLEEMVGGTPDRLTALVKRHL